MTYNEALEALIALARYGLACLEETREELGDLEGGWLQDKAQELGLLHEVHVTEPCDPDFCRCAEWGDFPQECLRYSPLMNEARKILGDEEEG